MRKCLIVYSDYYREISKNLIFGCKSTLNKNQIPFELYCVDGSYEIPQLINIKLKSKIFGSAIGLGCIIKGQTPHFDFISQASTNAIMDISVNNKKPVGNGIITCLNMKQAKARKRKVAEAAKSVISILSQKWELILTPRIIQKL